MTTLLSGAFGRIDWRRWVPEAPLAVLALALGLLEARGNPSLSLLVFGIAAGVLLSRQAPAAALAVVWAVGLLQLFESLPLLTIELAIVIVAFGCARWGTTETVVASGLSIPAAAAVQVVYGYALTPGVLVVAEGVLPYRVVELIGSAALGVTVLGVPWLAGLSLRALANARNSQVGQELAEGNAALALRQADQAREIARLREDQSRLARDVHDVVGHSLAVILAQAESAQYLGEDPAQLKATMATIATSARSSLQDVRQVLSATGAAPPRGDGLETLVEGIRASGREVVVEEVGSVRPLPPELDVVAHRVLQEMLTNAVKHGRRDRPILLERHWPTGGFERDLRIEVRNVVATDDSAPSADPSTEAGPASGSDDENGAVEETVDMDATRPIGPPGSGAPGHGLEGMRRRVDAVGGRLDVRRRVEAGEPTFTVTAWVPVSGQS